MGGGAPEYTLHGPGKRIDPWAYLMRFMGLLLVVMGIIWLTRFMDPRSNVAKISFVTAGLLWGQAARIAKSNRTREPHYRELGGLWFFRITALLCLAGGLQAVMVIDPFVVGPVIHFLSGGLALFFGALIFNRKILYDNDAQNGHDVVFNEEKKERLP